MESNDYKNNYAVNSLEETKEIKGNYKKISLKKTTSLSFKEEYIDNEEINKNINFTMRNEDVIQKNIFDHDISVNYVRNRHKHLHMKKPNSKLNLEL